MMPSQVPNKLLESTHLNPEAFRTLHTGGYIGSSDIAIVCGKNPYQSVRDLYLAHVGEKEREDVSKLPRVRLGSLMEPVLGILFQDRHGGFIAAPNTVYQKADEKEFICTPDFFWYPEIVAITEWDAEAIPVECKNVGITGKKVWGEASAPFYYVCQLNWQLGILGKEKGYFSTLVAGNADWHFTPELPFDEILFNHQLECGRYFIKCVKDKTPPDEEHINFLMGNY